MRFILLLVLFLLSQILFTQSAYRLEQNQKQDVVFSGVENPIAVEISGVSNQNMQLIPSF